MLIGWLVGIVVIMAVNYNLAKSFDRNVTLWVLLALLFGIFSTIPLALLGEKEGGESDG